VFDLMFNLNATEEQLNFPVIYGSAKNGWMGPEPFNPTNDVSHLLDVILEFVPPPVVNDGTLQMQITNIDHSPYIGRIAIGRVSRGTIKAGAAVSLVRKDGQVIKGRIRELFVFDGLGKSPAQEVHSGDLCAFSGLESFDIGDTLTDPDHPDALPPLSVDEPTMSMLFTVNNSPFFGKEGKFVTSRQLRDRLFKETEKNLALRVEETDSPDTYLVYGRGILHLSILIETMRREGYEMQIGQPRVIIKEIDGKKHEPVETLNIDVPETYASKVIELVSQRKGEMLVMVPRGDVTHLEFIVPSRGLIGLRTLVLNASAGEAVMAHNFNKFAPWKGAISSRINGTLISMDTGTVIAYALNNLQDRGRFFVAPGDAVYVGQVVGEHTRSSDLVVNVNKSKKLTNMRASGSDDKAKLAPPVRFSLEEALEFIQKDEYVEVTPKSIRLRKILLGESDRKRASR
jgi:GTP-binding protein